MSHFDSVHLNLDTIVDQVKLKERLFIFLQSRDYEKELERSCVYFQRKIAEENQSNCAPIFVTITLKFSDFEDGKHYFN